MIDLSKLRINENSYSVKLIMQLIENRSDEITELSQIQCIWIENVFTGIPVPTIAWDENAEPGSFKVFKGNEFVYGLMAFINNGLGLTYTQFYPGFQGMKFKELPPQFRRKINDRNYNVFYIYPGVPKEIADMIIKRFN